MSSFSFWVRFVCIKQNVFKPLKENYGPVAMEFFAASEIPSSWIQDNWQIPQGIPYDSILPVPYILL